MPTDSIIVKYPLDLSGTNPNNRIPNEEHTLSPGLNRSVIPKYGAFFTESVIVTDAASGRELDKGDDFVPILYVKEASERAGKEICAGIVVTNRAVSDDVLLTYHPVGGGYSNYVQVILELIETLNLDDRSIMYGDLLGKPDLFAPGEHLHDIGDLYGFEYIVEAIMRMRDAVLLGDQESHNEIINLANSRYQAIDLLIDQLTTTLNSRITAHLEDKSNSHDVTAAQVGLPLVSNFSIASMAEAEAGALNTRYMTPLSTNRLVDKLFGSALRTHESRRDNPHYVTADQVGLGNVPNLAMASAVQARYGADGGSFMSPYLTNLAIMERQYAAGVTASGMVKYNGQTKAAGMFYSNTVDATNPTSNNRLKYDGYFYASRFYGNGASVTNLMASNVVGGTGNKLPNTVFTFASNAEAINQSNETVLSTRGAHKAFDSRLYTAADNKVGAIKYNAFTPVGGQFHGGSTTITGITRLNYNGYFAASKLYVKGFAQIIHEVYSPMNIPPLATANTNGQMTNAHFKLLSGANSEWKVGSDIQPLVTRDTNGDSKFRRVVADLFTGTLSGTAAIAKVISGSWGGSKTIIDAIYLAVVSNRLDIDSTGVVNTTKQLSADTRTHKFRLLNSAGTELSSVDLFAKDASNSRYASFSKYIAAPDYKYTSDIRLKENINDVSSDEIYDKFNVDAKTFNYKTDTPDDVILGIIADHVEAVHELGITKDANGIKHINNQSYLAILSSVCQTQKSKIATLEETVAMLIQDRISGDKKLLELQKQVSELVKR